MAINLTIVRLMDVLCSSCFFFHGVDTLYLCRSMAENAHTHTGSTPKTHLKWAASVPRPSARAHNIAAGGFLGQFYEPRQTWPNVCGNIEPAAPSGRDRLRFLWGIHFNTSFASASENIYIYILIGANCSCAHVEVAWSFCVVLFLSK